MRPPPASRTRGRRLRRSCQGRAGRASRWRLERARRSASRFAPPPVRERGRENESSWAEPVSMGYPPPEPGKPRVVRTSGKADKRLRRLQDTGWSVMDDELTLQFAGGKDAPVRARYALLALDGALADVRDTVRLLVSELVTNSVLHAGADGKSTIRLRVVTGA